MYDHNWSKQDFVQQYFERLRGAYVDEALNIPRILETIEYDRNYGVIFLMDEVLNRADQDNFVAYLLERLKAFGYQLGNSTENEWTLQASVRKRVSGIQLFGTVKLVQKSSEVRLLVTPYADRQYEKAIDRSELMDVLFA